jgi:PIN domain nuclease of toxin-antitoxin system
MRLLLDTHVFLWYTTAAPKLPAAFRAAIQDPNNEVYLRVASVWEAVIKHDLGKLPLPAPPATTCRGSGTHTRSPACRSTKERCRT